MALSEVLKPFTTYSLRASACTKSVDACSPKSEALRFKTSVAAPGSMDPPGTRFLGNASFLLSWDAPSEANGPLSMYQIELFPDYGPVIVDFVEALVVDHLDVRRLEHELFLPSCELGEGGWSFLTSCLA